MGTRSDAVVSLHIDQDGQGEQHRARRRFAAIVRALAAMASAMRPPANPSDASPAELPAADAPDQPTRRANRLRRLFGRLSKRPLQGGKSRRHAR